MQAWKAQPLLSRIRYLRHVVPPVLVLLVVGYQLGIARALEDAYGHLIHYGVEIAFYSLAGPVVTWLTLTWVEHRLAEKEALENEVRAREQHLATLTAASADAILSLDRQGHIASWNQVAEKIFGYAADTVVGQPLMVLLPQTTLLAERFQRDGLVQNFETVGLRSDGREIVVELTQTLIGTPAVAMPVSSLVMRDVTSRRERAAVVEEERARIARDLHDGVAQTLYFLALKTDMAATQIGTNPDQVASDLKEIGQQARQIIREVRRTIFALRPLDWSESGFLPALRRFADDFAEQVGWRVSFVADEIDLVIPPRLEPTLFRLVQESLNNVAKHAEADQVWISLERDESFDNLVLTIRDNGRGFDTQAVSYSGLGLTQMRQRLEAIGGVFQVESTLGQETVMTARLPL